MVGGATNVWYMGYSKDIQTFTFTDEANQFFALNLQASDIFKFPTMANPIDPSDSVHCKTPDEIAVLLVTVG
jgi:hypothetical protein